MAELKNAEASVEALATTTATLRQLLEEQECHDEEAVETLQGLVASAAAAVDGDVHATMDKFRERAKTVDPITNEPRFGPKTMARVTEMLRRYDALYEELISQELLTTLRQRVEAFDEKKVRDAARADELQRQQALAHEAHKLEQERQRQREEDEQEAQRQREVEAERERVAALARLAQLKREERERQRLADEARAREEAERLARQNATAAVGLDALQLAVEKLCEGMRSDAMLQRKTLQTLLVLISNVCAAPENAAFRHIPKDNAHFHSDIGQYDGGHDCLLAVGFKELETEPGKRVFILEEPDLSEDFDKWSNWFDGLKEMKEWIESHQLHA